MKPVYIAAYHQSTFGKLTGMGVPEIVTAAIDGACREIGVAASALDVGSIGAACNVSLNEQGLLAGLMAGTPGLSGKPIEAVENACASGGQAALSVIQKLQLGMGEAGIAVGFEKMRDAEGKLLPHCSDAACIASAAVLVELRVHNDVLAGVSPEALEAEGK